MIADAKTNRAISIALVEDDLVLRDRILVPKLQSYGFTVDPFGTAKELYRAIPKTIYDIVVLDVGLPDEDGFSVTRRLRTMQMTFGIAMLTGRGEARDHVRGLTEGADAYLDKPVDIDVLAATLHSLTRRLAGLPMAASTGGRAWRLDANGWCLMSPKGKLIAMTKSERRLMSTLLKEPGTMVSREHLIAAVAQDTYDYDSHRLEVMIYRLRRKVSDRFGEILPLVSVRGEGYVVSD